jgi:hypothetical protein
MTRRRKSTWDKKKLVLKADIPTRPITNNVDLDIAQVMWEESGRGYMAAGCSHKRAGVDPLNPFRTTDSDYEGT